MMYQVLAVEESSARVLSYAQGRWLVLTLVSPYIAIPFWGLGKEGSLIYILSKESQDYIAPPSSPDFPTLQK